MEVGNKMEIFITLTILANSIKKVPTASGDNLVSKNTPTHTIASNVWGMGHIHYCSTVGYIIQKNCENSSCQKIENKTETMKKLCVCVCVYIYIYIYIYIYKITPVQSVCMYLLWIQNRSDTL